MTGTSTIYEEMRSRLLAVHRLYYRERIWRGIVLSSALVVSVILISALFELLFRFGLFGRSLILGFSLLSLLLAGIYLIIRPFLQFHKILPHISEKKFALRVGEKFPEIKDRLRNLLEIFQESGRSAIESDDHERHYSPELIDAAFADLQHSTSMIHFGSVVSFRDVRSLSRRLALAALPVLILFMIPSLGLTDAFDRVIHCQTDFRPPAAFVFVVTPGSTEVVKSGTITISAQLQDNPAAAQLHQSLPSAVSLNLAQEGVEKPEIIDIEKDSLDRYVHTLAVLKQSVDYFFETGDIQSARYTLTVVDRPFIRSLRLKIIPPFYTRLSPKILDENIGDALALPGSRLEWNIETSKAIKNADVIFSNGAKIPLVSDGNQLHGLHTLISSTTYHIELEDHEGFRSINPIAYKAEVVQDEPPTIAILYPAKNVDATEEMQIPLRIQIRDDFGFSKLQIAYKLVQSRYEQPSEEYSYQMIRLPDTSSATVKESVIDYEWDLTHLQLVPEDVVEYRAEVFDNDPILGPKAGYSERYLIRLPSLDEIFADVDKTHEQMTSKLDESLKEAEDLKKDLDELARDMKKNQQIDWQKQQKSEDLAKRYHDLQKKIEDAARSVESMTEEMQKNNVLSTETLEKYLELQKLMQEINTPEFRAAMQKMQDAMQKISPDQLREAMQQIQFSEETFRKSIERTLNLLKRIHIEQKIDELVRRADELQRQQEQLQAETSKLAADDRQKADELARRQEDIKRQLDDLQKQMPELRSKMEELSKEMPMEELQKAEEAANNSDLEQSLQESSSQLRSMQKQSAMNSQQQARNRMRELSQRLSEMEQQLLSDQMAETMNALRKAMMDLLELSKRQEELKNRSNGLDPNSQQFRDLSEQQMDLRSDLNSVTNGLAELSQRSFAVTPEMGKSIGKAMGQMNQAMNGLGQRNGSYAGQQQGEAMASLNKAATQVQESMNAMQQSAGNSGGMSLMQQLRQMAAQQQGINMQTKELGEGKGLSQEQKEQVGRLAAQQEAVRKSLEQLNKESQGSEDRRRIMGDLQKIADDMKEVVQNMEQQNINPNTIRQQERILSRLLDAQSSMRERDFEKRRKAITGTTPTRKSPAELQNQEQPDQLRRDLLKALEEGYSKDYQELIRKYYEMLGKRKE